MKTIDYARLLKMNPCADGLEWFYNTYGTKRVNIRELADELLRLSDELSNDLDEDEIEDYGDDHPSLWLLWGLIVFLSDSGKSELLRKVISMLDADGADCRYERGRFSSIIEDSLCPMLNEFYPELSELVMKGYIDIEELTEYVFTEHFNCPPKDVQ